MKKIQNVAQKSLENNELIMLIGGAKFTSYKCCETKTEPTESSPCGDIKTVTYTDVDDNWSVAGSFTDCITCPV